MIHEIFIVAALVSTGETCASEPTAAIARLGVSSTKGHRRFAALQAGVHHGPHLSLSAGALPLCRCWSFNTS
jgi:hypothetical protein